MTSKLFLVLAGLFAGMWVRDGSTTLFELGVPWLALLALLTAFAADPRPADSESKSRLEEAYRQWLDAWHVWRTAPDRERLAADDALTSAAHMVALTANDRVLKSLQTARENDLSAAAVAHLVLDMRRSLRRGGVTLKASDLEAFLAPARQRLAARAPVSGPATPASFLS